jgi:hypothetical protein
MESRFRPPHLYSSTRSSPSQGFKRLGRYGVVILGVDLMPLPDAPVVSPRVYKLLKTKDLETLAGDDSVMAGVGDPITIEMLNEDELRRLILVQLARLSVKSEWNGLLG